MTRTRNQLITWAAGIRGASTFLLALGMAWSLACGPIGPVPGGALSGTIGDPVVSDWSSAANVETAQLETRPHDPHSVNTWFATIDDRLYVPTSMILGPKEPSTRSWVSHVEADPRVRIRLGGTVYDRIARRVEDPAEYDAARAALEARYEIAPEDRDPERVIWIYRLDPRSG
jgi:hypothetical protein